MAKNNASRQLISTIRQNQQQPKNKTSVPPRHINGIPPRYQAQKSLSSWATQIIIKQSAPYF